MSNYIAMAYVRVKELSERKRIKEILTANGRRRFNVNPDKNEYIILNSFSNGNPIWMTSTNAHPNPDFINCNAYTPNGTEEEAVKLFLELAKMRDKSKHIGQWRSKGKECERLTAKTIDTYYWSHSHICTPLEVAEAYKAGRIEL